MENCVESRSNGAQRIFFAPGRKGAASYVERMGGLFLAILAWVSRTCWPVLPGSRQQPLREASGPQPRAQFLICLSRINAGVAHALSGFEQSNLFQTYDVRRPEPAVTTLPSGTGHQAKSVLDRQQKSAFEGVLGFVLCKRL
jgi:hypothetical protein